MRVVVINNPSHKCKLRSIQYKNLKRYLGKRKKNLPLNDLPLTRPSSTSVRPIHSHLISLDDSTTTSLEIFVDRF